MLPVVLATSRCVLPQPLSCQAVTWQSLQCSCFQCLEGIDHHCPGEGCFGCTSSAFTNALMYACDTTSSTASEVRHVAYVHGRVELYHTLKAVVDMPALCAADLLQGSSSS